MVSQCVLLDALGVRRSTFRKTKMTKILYCNRKRVCERHKTQSLSLSLGALLRPDERLYRNKEGREKLHINLVCAFAQVHLLGSSGEEVKSRRVPLRLVLMYENMHRVHNQEILKLSPDSKLVIDDQGKATLRVRIEEVSKNHQKQVWYATNTRVCVCVLSS